MKNFPLGGKTNRTTSDFNLEQRATETQGYPYADLDSFTRTLLQQNGIPAGNVKSWMPWVINISGVSNAVINTATSNFFDGENIVVAAPANPIALYFGNISVVLNATAVTANVVAEVSLKKYNNQGALVSDFVLQQTITPIVAPANRSLMLFRSVRAYEYFNYIQVTQRTDATGVTTASVNYCFDGIKLFTA